MHVFASLEKKVIQDIHFNVGVVHLSIPLIAELPVVLEAKQSSTVSFSSSFSENSFNEDLLNLTNRKGHKQKRQGVQRVIEHNAPFLLGRYREAVEAQQSISLAVCS